MRGKHDEHWLGAYEQPAGIVTVIADHIRNSPYSLDRHSGIVK